MNPLPPREAVAAILSTPLDSRAFFAGLDAAEWFRLVREANPPRVAAEQTNVGRGAAALPGFDAAKGKKGKKARA
jgi:hypothetical protein